MKKLRTTAAVAASLAVLLTGCGGDDEGGNGDPVSNSGSGDSGDTGAESGGDFAEQPAQDILDTAKASMIDLQSVRVAGEITSDGEAIELDLRTDADGNCTGTLATGTGGGLEILGTGGQTWFLGDEKFLSDFPATIRQEIEGKWIVDNEGNFAEFCDLDELMDEMVGADDESEESFSVVGTEDLDGEEVVKVEQDDAEDGVSHAYIQTGGDHLFVRLERTSGEDQGAITFSEFNEELDVTAPDEADVVDLNQL